MRTNKVDFITLPDFDYSRTRVTDETMGYEWDRVITYIKDPGLYVVFDIMKGRKEQYFTAVNVTRILYGGMLLFEQKPSYFGLAFDGSPDVQGVGKARYWRETVTLK